MFCLSLLATSSWMIGFLNACEGETWRGLRTDYLDIFSLGTCQNHVTAVNKLWRFAWDVQPLPPLAGRQGRSAALANNFWNFQNPSSPHTKILNMLMRLTISRYIVNKTWRHKFHIAEMRAAFVQLLKKYWGNLEKYFGSQYFNKVNKCIWNNIMAFSV